MCYNRDNTFLVKNKLGFMMPVPVAFARAYVYRDVRYSSHELTVLNDRRAVHGRSSSDNFFNSGFMKFFVLC